MRSFFPIVLLTPLISGAAIPDTPTATSSTDVPIATPPSTDFGSWDISLTYASIPSGAYQRNITAIYTNPTQGIWTKADCIESNGPGEEPVNFCTNSDFEYNLGTDGKSIDVKQTVQFENGVMNLLGSGVLDVTCASQRSCWGRGQVTAAIS